MIKRPGKLTAEMIDEIVAKREKGWSYDRLAARFDVSPGAIHYQCLKHGAVSPHQRSRPVPTEPGQRVGKDGRIQRLFTVADDERLIALEASGLKYGEIARQMGRGLTSIRIRLMTIAQREDLPA